MIIGGDITEDLKFPAFLFLRYRVLEMLRYFYYLTPVLRDRRLMLLLDM